MVKIALLGAQYAAQLQENPDALSGLEVIYCGNSVAEFRARALAGAPDAVVLDLGQLAEAPDEEIRQLITAIGSEIVMVTYTYARRALIKSLQNERTRVVQAPLSLSLLRAHLSDLIVRETFRSSGLRPSVEPGAPTRRVTPAQLQATARAADALPLPTAPRYTAAQLGRLTEIASTVQCECPNQLARIVTVLRGFEDYSRDCESKDDEDARMHALLYRQTGAARAVMEEALTALIRHERIEL
jgi:hypothetical protein